MKRIIDYMKSYFFLLETYIYSHIIIIKSIQENIHR